MSKFKIEVLNEKPEKWEGILLYPCQIMIGNYIEKFSIAENCWTIEQHVQQWKDGLERIKTYNTSCLVKSITTTNKGPLFISYALYRCDDTVYIREQFNNIREKNDKRRKITIPYDPTPCYEKIRPRVEDSEVWENNIDISEL